MQQLSSIIVAQQKEICVCQFPCLLLLMPDIVLYCIEPDNRG